MDQALHRAVLKRREPIEAKIAEDDRRAREQRQAESVLFGAAKLTKEKLRELLDSNRRMYYRTEELNDKLFLHFGGFTKLENLEKFTGLKTLYAESNALDTMTGLETMAQIRSLFLQQNCIRKMEGLHHHPNLWALNLSENFIDKIEGLAGVPELNTLNLAGNRIGFHGLSDVADLANSSVCCLDLQNNKIDDIDFLPEILMRMPQLKVLYLKGNPFVKKLPNYRKTLIAHLPNVSYLDDRPVFKEEHRAAIAFNRGGLEEERAERRRIKEEEREAHNRNMTHFRETIARCREEKREYLAMRKQDKFTDETDPVESPEKRMARAKGEWEKKNAHDLKDDAKEYAMKYTAKSTETVAPSNAPIEPDKTDAEKEKDVETEKLDVEKEKVSVEKDTRALVYDDIWDEPAHFKQTSVSTNHDAVYRAAFQPPPRTSATASQHERLQPFSSCVSAPSNDEPTDRPKKRVGWSEDETGVRAGSGEKQMPTAEVPTEEQTVVEKQESETLVEDVTPEPAPIEEDRPSHSKQDSHAWSLAIQEEDADEEAQEIEGRRDSEIEGQASEVIEVPKSSTWAEKMVATAGNMAGKLKATVAPYFQNTSTQPTINELEEMD